MNIISITKENLEKEHICCAISNNNDCQVVAKKSWIEERLSDGLIFKKGDVRGKCFIEYIPAEKAWVPIEADGWMYIDCLWVSGQFKGHGYSNQLLQECINDSISQGKKGIVILSSDKKLGFLADSKYLKYKGFRLADTAQPYFQLYYMPLTVGSSPSSHRAETNSFALPHFKPQAKNGTCPEKGFVLYYTHQCPFTAKYVPIIESIAYSGQIPFKSVLITTAEKAQNASTPFTTYSLYYDGKFVTHEILSDKKFKKIIETVSGTNV